MTAPIIHLLVVEEEDRWVLELERSLRLFGGSIKILAHARPCGIDRLFRNPHLTADFALINQNQLNRCNNAEALTESVRKLANETIFLYESLNRNILYDIIQANIYIATFKTQVNKIPKLIYSLYQNPLSKKEQMLEILIDEIDRLKEIEERYRKDHKVMEKLTATEFKVYRLRKEGKKVKEIADELFIEEKTVKNHICNIRKKMSELELYLE